MKQLSLAALLFLITGITGINAQNYALDFDGVDDFVSIGTISGFTESVSVEALINPSSIPSNYPPIIKSTDEFALEIDHTNSEIKFHVKIGGGWASSPGYVIPTLNTWYHVAGVYDGSAIRLYIDGTEIGTATAASGAIASSATNVELGRDPSNTDRRFNGMIDELRIWNVARTQTQINDNREVELIGNETGLIAYYNMNEGSGTTLTNRSGTTSPSYNGTINGATYVTGPDIDSPMGITYVIPSDNYTIGLPLNGYVNINIDWGDGSTETVIGSFSDSTTETTHTYGSAGTYTVKINGQLQRFGSINTDYESTGVAALNSIETFGNIGIQSIFSFARGAVGLIAIPAQIPATVYQLIYTFNEATTFNLDISGWDVSNVTTLQGAFRNASSFNQDIGNWDVSNVTNLQGAFYGATAFNQDIGSWNVSNVTTLTQSFEFATSFNQDISGWDVSSVTNFAFAFNGASAFDQNLGSWDFSAASGNAWRLNSMIQQVALSYPNYDALLISLSNQTIPSNVNFGNWSTYSDEAVTARNYLINEKGWMLNGDSYYQTLSINEIAYGDLQVYAPMGSGTINIAGSVPIGTSLALYDMLGKQVLGAQLRASTGTQSVATGDLATGTYIAVLKGNGGKRSIKLILGNN